MDVRKNTRGGWMGGRMRDGRERERGRGRGMDVRDGGC